MFKNNTPKIYYLKKKNLLKRKFHLARILFACPNKKTIVKAIRITTPRKPNSARRKTTKSFYRFNKATLNYIPGGAHNLKKYNRILIRGQGARDLPGIYSTGIRGKFDLLGVGYKTKRRSIYGVKKICLKESK